MQILISKKVYLTVFITVFSFFAVFTASADFDTTMDSILSEEMLTYGSASYVLLTGTGVLGDEATLQEAAGKMAQQFPDTALEWNEPVTLGRFSYMIMNAYEIEGGIMYRIFPGPRYAVRELRFKKIIQQRAYSGMDISGERALRILGRVLDRKEAGDEK